MTDAELLLRAAQHDATARLVYADFLEEQGDSSASRWRDGRSEDPAAKLRNYGGGGGGGYGDGYGDGDGYGYGYGYKPCDTSGEGSVVYYDDRNQLVFSGSGFAFACGPVAQIGPHAYEAEAVMVVRTGQGWAAIADDQAGARAEARFSPQGRVRLGEPVWVRPWAGELPKAGAP